MLKILKKFNIKEGLLKLMLYIYNMNNLILNIINLDSLTLFKEYT